MHVQNNLILLLASSVSAFSSSRTTIVIGGLFLALGHNFIRERSINRTHLTVTKASALAIGLLLGHGIFKTYKVHDFLFLLLLFTSGFSITSSILGTFDIVL